MASTTGGRRKKLPSLKKHGGSTQQGKSASLLGGPSKPSRSSSGERGTEDAKAVEFLQSVAATLTDRASTYPPYSQEANDIAAVWNALDPERQLRAEDVAALMLVMKLVRYRAGNSPDSLTDLVGYAARIRGME